MVRRVMNSAATLAAAAAADTDEVFVGQGGTPTLRNAMKRQSFAAVWAWINGKGRTAWTTVTKLTSESRASTTTFAADSTLKFPVAANAKVAFRATVFVDFDLDADIKFEINGPASPVSVRTAHFCNAPVSTVFGAIGNRTAYNQSVSVTASAGSGEGGCIRIDGIVENGATAGDIEFRWAQDTSDAGNTTVRLGSYIEYSVF